MLLFSKACGKFKRMTTFVKILKYKKLRPYSHNLKTSTLSCCDSALWQFAFQRCNLSSPAPSSRAIRQPGSPTELSFTSFEAEWAQKNMSLGETNDKLVNRWAVSPDYSMYGLESSVNLECKRLCKRLHRLDEKSVKERGFISCHFQHR